MEIKKAGIVNVNEIKHLAYQIWPDAYGDILSKEQLHYMLELFYNEQALIYQIENLQHQFIILYDTDEAIGFASYSPIQIGDNNTFKIHKIYVMPGRQGKGLGKLLLTYIITEIKKSGASILELNVNRHNKALYFYQKMGFTIVQSADIAIGNGYFMNDYIMQLAL
ncbi:MAG: GNAT family N-acetyltransferase [Bacteroidetes bacterium]|nr:GNAT family N-acetyltransferase [Bacteroidota bacterium]MBS1756052.1 GNAT family N-acetyltransferase [Bacteroidota bacterium]